MVVTSLITAAEFSATLEPVCLSKPTGSRIKLNNTSQGESVNKTELIDEIAKVADISKASASRALEAMIESVTATLKHDGSVTLAGFGTFAVSARAARTGRNPRTGEEIQIGASKVPKFKPSKALKDALK